MSMRSHWDLVEVYKMPLRTIYLKDERQNIYVEGPISYLLKVASGVLTTPCFPAALG